MYKFLFSPFRLTMILRQRLTYLGIVSLSWTPPICTILSGVPLNVRRERKRDEREREREERERGGEGREIKGGEKRWMANTSQFCMQVCIPLPCSSSEASWWDRQESLRHVQFCCHIVGDHHREETLRRPVANDGWIQGKHSNICWRLIHSPFIFTCCTPSLPPSLPYR